ncbi:MAG: hypothetical protein ABEK84_00165, partial [Salinibacter sp.]
MDRFFGCIGQIIEMKGYSARSWGERYHLQVVLAFLLMGASAGRPAGAQQPRRFVKGGQFSAPEAFQAVAVDDEYVYAIDSHAIGKYDKTTGKRVDRWTAAEEGPIHHLNSGVVIDDTLYCAHSNFPEVPMVSSIELWDVETM